MWAEFSTLDVGVLVYDIRSQSWEGQSNLKVKTQPRQLLGYLPLAFMLTELSNFVRGPPLPILQNYGNYLPLCLHFQGLKILWQITIEFKFVTIGQCYKNFTVAIYCHSMVITKVIQLYNTEWWYCRGMMVNYHGKKLYNIAPPREYFSIFSWFLSPRRHSWKYFFQAPIWLVQLKLLSLTIAHQSNFFV